MNWQWLEESVRQLGHGLDLVRGEARDELVEEVDDLARLALAGHELREAFRRNSPECVDAALARWDAAESPPGPG